MLSSCVSSGREYATTVYYNVASSLNNSLPLYFLLQSLLLLPLLPYPPYQMCTWPSHPPVTKAPNSLENSMQLTGFAWLPMFNPGSSGRFK